MVTEKAFHFIASLLSLQWGLHNTGSPQNLTIDHYTSGTVQGREGEDIRLPETKIATKKTIVAILDTGIDFKHPQLKTVLAGKGYNFADGNDNVMDTHGHGTHLAGIIAAQSRYPGDFEGLSKNILILPIKVVKTGPNNPIRPQAISAAAGEGASALAKHVADGIHYAIQNGAQVINLSLGWPLAMHFEEVDQAMKEAAENHVIVVSSAANDSTLANLYPCIYENVICVGAHAADGTPAYFSNYGPMVNLLAPGQTILSTWPTEKRPNTFAGQYGYEIRHGSSMAAPFVAGSIAELISRGFSPEEARNRILLGTRPTPQKSLYTSRVALKLSQNQSDEKKSFQFGNLDLSQALTIPPSPLILPLQKATIEVAWNGRDETLCIPIVWINRWKKAAFTKIKIENEIFVFDEILENEKVTTEIRLPIDLEKQQSFLTLKASVITHNYEKADLEIPIQITLQMTASQLPKGAIVEEISGLSSTAETEVLRVEPVDLNESSPKNNFLFISQSSSSKITTLALAQNNRQTYRVIKSIEIPNPSSLLASLPASLRVLKSFRLPDQSYAVFLLINDGKKQFVKIKYFNSSFEFSREIDLGTQVTVLPESFRWIKLGETYTPIWISVGLTPPLDLPEYDPYDQDFEDSRNYRIYFLQNQDLRTLPLERDELPSQILLDQRILISKGYENYVEYFLLTLEKIGEKVTVIKKERLPGLRHRILIGGDLSSPVLRLNGHPPHTLLTTSGDFRETGIGEEPFDLPLLRSTTLDSFTQVIGAFSSGPQSQPHFFAQTLYQLIFYEGENHQSVSTSLNRYSYIPSLISNGFHYPVIVHDQPGISRPGIYTPAGPTNFEVSQIIFAQPDLQKITLWKINRPARLRIANVDPTCIGLANLIPANKNQPAQQIFICGSKLIRVPISL